MTSGDKNTTAKLCMHGERYVMADGSEIDLLTWRVRGHRGSGFELFSLRGFYLFDASFPIVLGLIIQTINHI
jgi:hypothetical protein